MDMTKNYKHFFGFEKEPFRSDIDVKDILETPQLKAAGIRFKYAADLGAVFLLTGEVGSGKSTSIRYLLSDLHPSEYKLIYVTATTGSILELYRLIMGALGMNLTGNSKSKMTTLIKREIMELVQSKKMKTVLIIDEASLLRLEVFVELHTLCQFEMDSKPYLPIVLAGQSNLIDKLMYPGSTPISSRIVAKSHFVGAKRELMESYLFHHLAIAGISEMLFDEAAITAIHQGSGGIFRKANHLARGALIACAREDKKLVDADHVRIAASEVF